MERVYAGFDRRLLAAIIDVTLASFLLIPIVEIMNYFILGDKQIDFYLNQAAWTSEESQVGFSWFMKKLWEDGYIINYIIIQATSLLLFAAYMIVFWVKYGATPGKWLLGCKVVDNTTGENLDYKQAIKRFLAYIPATLALCIGFFSIKWNKECRGWHDRMTNTVCIRSDESLNLLKKVFNMIYLRTPNKPADGVKQKKICQR